MVREWIAESRVRIEQARLLVLKTAWLMDTVGNKGAHTEIQAIKIAVPAMAEWVLDKAIQVHGGAGVSQDTPLAELWAQARTLRLADGPDEVHRASLAKRELAAGPRPPTRPQPPVTPVASRRRTRTSSAPWRRRSTSCPRVADLARCPVMRMM